MQYAIVDGIRMKAAKQLKGKCEHCGSEMIPKCGINKIDHWAHKGNRNCDPWWENETQWHRAWKNNFPTAWQEIILLDEATGEKHIADVRTEYGLVIEFQHSHIEPDERAKREIFYNNMVWIVDGTRLKRDYPRFLKGKQSFRSTNRRGVFLVDFPDECFPAAWIGGSVPVIFDFKGTETDGGLKDWKHHLYYLYPKSNSGESVVAIISREPLIKSIITGEFFKQSVKSPVNKNITKSGTGSTHYYDPRKGKFVKRWRF
jgi:competence protein CoiA